MHPFETYFLIRISAGLLLVVNIKMFLFFPHLKQIYIEVVANDVLILRFQTDRSGQTVKSTIRLLLKRASDKVLHF